MKKVTLVEFNTKEIIVEDFRNSIAIQSCSSRPLARINGTSEYIPDFVDVEYANVERIIDSGVEHYIAADKNVIKYLHLITEESRNKEINKLNTEINKQKLEIKALEEFKKNVNSMRLFGRLKFLFTGVLSKETGLLKN